MTVDFPDDIRERLAQAKALLDNNQIVEASKICAEICAVNLDNAEARLISGIIKSRTGSAKEAVFYLQEAIRLDSTTARAHLELGTVYLRLARTDEAIACLREAVRADPGYTAAWETLANTLQAIGKQPEAQQCYREMHKQTLAQDPGNIASLQELALYHANQNAFTEAEMYFRRILEIQPDHTDALNYLSRVYYLTGRMAEATDLYHALLNAIDSGSAKPSRYAPLPRVRFEVHSNLVFALNYLPDISADTIFAEHKHWASTYCQSPIGVRFENEAVHGRRLRIGYVSPDLCRHSVAFFIQPILQQHEPERVETFCYSDVAQPDTTTAHLQELADNWRITRGQSDRNFIETVRNDRIDILVDLAGHTTNNRLLAFAQRAAPVQVTYLGYPNTTGLSAMDYRLSDPIADPADNDKFYTENLVRLPHSFLCFAPFPGSPDIRPAPVLRRGGVTFGSFNALAKLNEKLAAVWSTILKTVPDSRLLLKNPGFSDPATRNRVLSLFRENGVAESRLELDGWVSGYRDHLDYYGRVDVALDPFPYNGTTTTCEALWMGVPVVTLAGTHHAGRVGTSLLQNAGLGEYVTHSVDHYCNLAIELAANPSQLSQCRQYIRKKLSASAVCDAESFTLELELAYADMWKTWCSGSNRTMK